MPTPSITPAAYIDANIFKFAATALVRLFPRKQVIHYDGQTTEHRYFESRFVNPNDRISNPKLMAEVRLIETVANQVKAGRLKAVADLETHFETWGFPNMDSVHRRFYGAPVGPAPPPIHVDRFLFCAGEDPLILQRNFLRDIRYPRFLELQKVTGGYQGKGRHNWNQVIDAYALWCAEHNQCDYFLTLDFRLIRIWENAHIGASTIKLMIPSQLLAVIEN
jgi:hypothetical protein